MTPTLPTDSVLIDDRLLVACLLDAKLTLPRLPAHIGLPASRELVPEMAGVARRHPQLNVLNIEATAAALLLSARVLLAPPASRRILPTTLADEHIRWDTVELGLP